MTRFLAGAAAVCAFIAMVTALHIANKLDQSICLSASVTSTGPTPAYTPAWAPLMWLPLVNPPGTEPGTEVAIRRDFP